MTLAEAGTGIFKRSDVHERFMQRKALNRSRCKLVAATHTMNARAMSRHASFARVSGARERIQISTCCSLPWIEAVIVLLMNDEPVAKLQEDGETSSHLVSRT